jgi:hypothetical protein
MDTTANDDNGDGGGGDTNGTTQEQQIVWHFLSTSFWFPFHVLGNNRAYMKHRPVHSRRSASSSFNMFWCWRQNFVRIFVIHGFSNNIFCSLFSQSTLNDHVNYGHRYFEFFQPEYSIHFGTEGYISNSQKNFDPSVTE